MVLAFQPPWYPTETPHALRRATQARRSVLLWVALPFERSLNRRALRSVQTAQSTPSRAATLLIMQNGVGCGSWMFAFALGLSH